MLSEQNKLVGSCRSVLMAVLSASIFGCGDPVSHSDAGQAVGAKKGLSQPSISADPAVVALVPASLKAKGEITFATNAPYAPLEYFDEDNKTLIGYDVDLGNAIASTMGLKAVWKNISFDSIIPGLQAGKYDVGMAGFSIEHERLEVLDFVSYYLSGGAFLIKQGSGVRAGSFDSLCGLRVAVQKGASQVDALEEASHACEQAGKPPARISQIADQNVVVLNLATDRVDVVVGDKPQMEYAARNTTGVCVVATYQTNHSIAGLGVPKGHPELLTVFQAAVNSLLRNGDYDRISAYWGTGAPQVGALTPEYVKTAASWGIGPDGTLKESKVFTDPASINEGHHFYYQPINEKCVRG